MFNFIKRWRRERSRRGKKTIEGRQKSKKKKKKKAMRASEGDELGQLHHDTCWYFHFHGTTAENQSISVYHSVHRATDNGGGWIGGLRCRVLHHRLKTWRENSDADLVYGWSSTCPMLVLFNYRTFWWALVGLEIGYCRGVKEGRDSMLGNEVHGSIFVCS